MIFPKRLHEDWGGSGITKPMYDWIRQHLPDGKHILELGSGDVSTWYLSEFYQMTSVEDNPVFWDKYKSRYIKTPLVNGWYDPAILAAELPKEYDLLLVDGPAGSEPRVGFLQHLDLFAKTDVPIVIDDTWRSVEMKMARALKDRLGGYLFCFEHFSVLSPLDYSAQSAPAVVIQSPKP